MVLFENLKLGSRVQTDWKGWIVKGTVRYAGGLITKEGDWVGVELDEPVGNTSGLFKGRRYFQCHGKHGIFIQPRKLHLLGNWRTMSASSYRTVTKESFVDDTLFGRKTTEMPKPSSWKDPIVITSDFAKSSTLSDPLTSNATQKQKINFHKRHLVGHNISQSRSAREKRFCDSGRLSRRSTNTFVPSSPSIPNIHVPRPVLRRMVESQYFGTSLPRHNTLY